MVVSMIQIISFPFCNMENCENDCPYFSVSVDNLPYQLEPCFKTNYEIVSDMTRRHFVLRSSTVTVRMMRIVCRVKKDDSRIHNGLYRFILVACISYTVYIYK